MTAKSIWINDGVMNKWIDLVLVLWKNKKVSGVVPTHILDACCIHMIGSIVNRIQLLWIEVILILVGCTYLCQPMDIIKLTNQSRGT